MENQFVPYEIALSLKELGFEEICLAIYNREETLRFNNLHNPIDRRKTGFPKFNDGKTPAPLWQQAFDWFRENYKLYAIITPNINMYWSFETTTVIVDMEDVPEYKHEITDDYSTYEEAREACLIKLIEISKSK